MPDDPIRPEVLDDHDPTPSLRSGDRPSRLAGPRFLPGELLAGRYRMAGLVGRGGMGEVYRAQDLKLGETVALKMLPEKLTADRTALARFHDEVRLARRITHPNVCRVFDIGEVDGLPFLSMELIEGDDMAVLLKRIGHLPVPKALDIARQMAAGLAAAHDRGVLHRDMKPANVMLDRVGRVKITDFGLAVGPRELHRAELSAGTPAYMAPEQLSGTEVTVRTDLYGWGLVTWKLLTGEHPFPARDRRELEALQRSGPPALSGRVDLRAEVERVLTQSLDPDPARRPGSLREAAARLSGGLDPLEAAVAAGETPSPEMVAEAGRRGAFEPRTVLALAAGCLLAIGLAAGLASQTDVVAAAPLPLRPEVLEHRATTILGELRPDLEPVVGASGWISDLGRMAWIRSEDPTPERWRRLSDPEQPIFHFWVRSAREVPPRGWELSQQVRSLPAVGLGEADVVVDPRGRLRRLVAPAGESEPSERTETDWSALLAAAGVSTVDVEPAAPSRIPPVFATDRRAWQGELGGLPVRFEAAAVHGRPVTFTTDFPWSAWGEAGESASYARIRLIMGILLPMVLLAGGLLAWHNLRKGRGDRRGAKRLSLAVAGVLTATGLLGMRHTFSGFEEVFRLLELAGHAIATGGLFALLYLALEPTVRRRWPRRIVAWTRMLNGDWRDPLVGRDLVVGVLLGSAGVAIQRASIVASEAMGAVLGRSDDLWETLFAGAPLATFALGHGAFRFGLINAFVWLFLAVALYVGTRRRWVTEAVLTLLLPAFLLGEVSGVESLPFVTGNVIFGVLAAVAVTRFGLLTSASFWWTMLVLQQGPVAWSSEPWLAPVALLSAGVLLGLVVGGSRVALGGRSIVGLTVGRVESGGPGL